MSIEEPIKEKVRIHRAQKDRLAEFSAHVHDPERIAFEIKRGITTYEGIGLKYILRDISEDDRQSLTLYLNRAKQTMLMLGLNLEVNTLPTIEQIKIFEREYTGTEPSLMKNDEVYGFCDHANQFLIVDLPRGFINLNSPQFEKVLSHEIGHFVTSKVMMFGNTGRDASSVIIPILSGLSWSEKPKYAHQSHSLFEEPMAELYSLFYGEQCDMVAYSPYPESCALVFSLIYTHALKNELEFKNECQRFLSASIRGDYSILKEYVATFGHQFIKQLYGLRYWSLGPSVHNPKFEVVAEDGNFLDIYTDFLNKMHTDGGLILPGFRTPLISRGSEYF